METRKFIDEKGVLNIHYMDGIMEQYDIKGMITPVICSHCRKTYDLTAVKVNHRYGDCDQFTTPCCGYNHADTREWKSFKDFTRIDISGIVTLKSF